MNLKHGSHIRFWGCTEGSMITVANCFFEEITEKIDEATWGTGCDGHMEHLEKLAAEKGLVVIRPTGCYAGCWCDLAHKDSPEARKYLEFQEFRKQADPEVLSMLDVGDSLARTRRFLSK